MKYSPWVVVLLLLPGMAVAQSEDAYSQVEPISLSSALTESPLPPPAETVPIKKHRWWGHVIPSDRAIWLISTIADIGQYAYQEVDTLETTHIKSGKGVREARLAVKMLVGTGAAGALVGEVRKGRHKKPKKHR